MSVLTLPASYVLADALNANNDALNEAVNLYYIDDGIFEMLKSPSGQHDLEYTLGLEYDDESGFQLDTVGFNPNDDTATLEGVAAVKTPLPKITRPDLFLWRLQQIPDYKRSYRHKLAITSLQARVQVAA